MEVGVLVMRTINLTVSWLPINAQNVRLVIFKSSEKPIEFLWDISSRDTMQPFGGTGGGSAGLPPHNPPNAGNHLHHHHHHPSSSASSSTASSSSSLAEDLLKLSTHLKQETLYVQNTKRQLVQLHEEVSRQSQGLAQQVWVCAHQRQNTETIHSASSSSLCMQRYR